MEPALSIRYGFLNIYCKKYNKCFSNFPIIAKPLFCNTIPLVTANQHKILQFSEHEKPVPFYLFRRVVSMAIKPRLLLFVYINAVNSFAVCTMKQSWLLIVP